MALAAAAGSKNGPPMTGRCAAAADAADFFAARGFLTREAFRILRNAELTREAFRFSPHFGEIF